MNWFKKQTKIAQTIKTTPVIGPDPTAKTPGTINTSVRALTGLVPPKITTPNPKIEAMVKMIQKRNFTAIELSQLMARLAEMSSIARTSPGGKLS
jgi:hypothetical protein